MWSREFHISLVTGYEEFADVDTVEAIRKFFIPYGETDVKPTRRDITLRLREWEEMKKIIDTVNNAYATHRVVDGVVDFLNFFSFP